MKGLSKILVAGLAAAALAGCDPYSDENTGVGQIMAVFSTDVGNGVVEGTASGAAWTLSPVTDDGGGAWPVVFVKFSKLLDGASIQTSPLSCVPAAAWLTVTENAANDATCPVGTAQAGGPPAWYSCYYPSSTSPAEGASVVFFKACDDTSTTGGGWGAVSTAEFGDTYVLTGSIRDKQGHSYAINVTANTAPDIAVIAFGTVTATSVALTWAGNEDPVPSGASTYDVQRAPDVAGAPGTFANVATGLAAAAYTDATVVTGTAYWYRVISHATNGTTSTGFEDTVTTP